jgi:hypothetical protein
MNSVWLSLLLSALTAILQWLLTVREDGGRLTDSQKTKLNRVIWRASQLEKSAVALGCTEGGVPEE